MNVIINRREEKRREGEQREHRVVRFIFCAGITNKPKRIANNRTKSKEDTHIKRKAGEDGKMEKEREKTAPQFCEIIVPC